MSIPGFWEILLIFAVIFLFFGAKRLPALSKALGEAIKNFRSGLAEGQDKNHK